MKYTWIVLCSALALVGCDKNRGGPGSDKNRDTGYGSSRDSSTYSASPMTRDTNSLLNTNSAIGAPGSSSGALTNSSSGTSSGSTPSGSTGTGSPGSSSGSSSGSSGSTSTTK